MWYGRETTTITGGRLGGLSNIQEEKSHDKNPTKPHYYQSC